MEQALRILKEAQFVGDADLHVGVGPDAVTPAVCDEGARIEYAIAEIRFRDRTQARRGAGSRHTQRLGVGHVSCMNQAPLLVDVIVIEQPIDGTPAGPGEAIVNFLGLFGDVNVDGRLVGHGGDGGQLFRRHGAQRVRSHADNAGAQWLQGSPASIQQTFVTAHTIDKAALILARFGAAEAGVCVEHRQ